AQGRERLDPYAFKCTAESEGSDLVKDLRGLQRRYFIATTVELLTTGVDVPCVRNIVFFKYHRSPISIYQMVGRGTRIDAPTGKLMFRVYDYTDATRLFGEDFVTKPTGTGGEGPGPEPPPPSPPEPTISVEGFDVLITAAGRFIVADVDGKAMPVPIDEYKARLAFRLVHEVHTLDDFRARWIDPPSRQELIDTLVTSGYSPTLVRMVDGKGEYDLYDVLAELGYGLAPKRRTGRADAFTYKHAAWLSGLPVPTSATLRALAGQFARAGTDGLENPQVFRTPEVVQAGGLPALKAFGKPADILRETKERLFAA
ncbi:MAG: restriction endonuclease subunit R, partial [Candidatus Rokubacteria bacterium]|nr:restriction endonuclease subunit R [Candidatus Rokubacteria bacterium]